MTLLKAIAIRKMVAGPDRKVAKVLLSAPRKARGKAYFVAKYQIQGAGEERVHQVRGVDAIQALSLALIVLGRELEKPIYRSLRWPYGRAAADLGFPKASDVRISAALASDIRKAVRITLGKKTSR